MLTHGNISRVIVFVSGLYRGHVGSLSEYQMLGRISQPDRYWLESLCEQCRLTRLSHGAVDALTESGREIAKQYVDGGDLRLAFRLFLYAYISETHPIWAYRIPMGREEAFAVMEKDEKFCFAEAGLADNPVADDVVMWWDSVAKLFRSHDDNANLEIGREGERLTMAYELTRTGFSPTWVSIDSNFAGYDVLSRESRVQPGRRMIEVKTTQKKLSAAEFYISKNEWETAETSLDRYYFYLWQIGGSKELAIVSAREMARHISKNQGAGKWVSVAVPFAEFASSFKHVEI